LDLTDVATGWTEQAAVPNKAQKWVFQALQDLRQRLPFTVLGFDSDNGGEFINHHLVAYCQEEYFLT
jgi:IS30 family transposase